MDKKWIKQTERRLADGRWWEAHYPRCIRINRMGEDELAAWVVIMGEMSDQTVRTADQYQIYYCVMLFRILPCFYCIWNGFQK